MHLWYVWLHLMSTCTSDFALHYICGTFYVVSLHNNYTTKNALTCTVYSTLSCVQVIYIVIVLYGYCNSYNNYVHVLWCHITITGCCPLHTIWLTNYIRCLPHRRCWTHPTRSCVRCKNHIHASCPANQWISEWPIQSSSRHLTIQLVHSGLSRGGYHWVRGVAGEKACSRWSADAITPSTWSSSNRWWIAGYVFGIRHKFYSLLPGK